MRRRKSLTYSANMNNLSNMTKPRKAIKTTADVIAAYKGTAACARRFDVGMTAVSNWRTEGIPPGYHYRMARELETMGYIVDGQALGWA